MSTVSSPEAYKYDTARYYTPDEKCPDEFVDAYVLYLQEYVDITESGEYLFRTLLDIPYYWNNKFDDSRAMDGRRIRNRFLNEDDSTTEEVIESFVYGWPVSVLEVLIALARKLDLEYLHTPMEDQAHVWFWMMMENLGLEHHIIAANRHFAYDDEINDIKAKVFCWMDKEYDDNGHGYNPFEPPPDYIHDLDFNKYLYKDASLWTQSILWISSGGYLL